MDSSTEPGADPAVRYRRVRLLGRGAMGSVWLAEDRVLHRTVAVKTVSGADEPEDRARVLREARLAAGLNHPNAVVVHDLFEVDGQPHVVMEYVAGRSLADALRADGRMAPDQVRRVGAELAAALAAAHRLGIVHRDVKPANVLLTGDGSAKLADFGVARQTDAVGTTATGMIVGTPAYLAPEIVRGEPADSRSDMWSLGATLYSALEGRSPFSRTGDAAAGEGAGDNVYAMLTRIVTEPPPRPGGAPALADPALADLVLALMAADPAARPSADEVARSIRERSQQFASGASSHRPRHRRRGVLAGAAVLVVVAAVGLTVALAGGDDVDGKRSQAATPRASGTRPASSATAAASYTSPGGITVRAPTGWLPDASAGIASVRDYRAPEAADRRRGAYFRIGIANTRPADSIEKEALGTQRYLEGADTKARLVRNEYTDFQGARAVTQEYTATNSAGIARRFLLRLWFHGGRTLEIELNAPDASWRRYEPLFDTLTSSCRVA